jgi:inner membrane protein
VFYPLVKKSLRFQSVWFFSALGYGTHGLLDACTTYGTQLLWPFTDLRFAWHNVSVIDPLFTLPLVGWVVASALRRNPKLAVYGMCWALSYLGFGLVQHQRALVAAEQIVASRGQEPVRLEVKPGFANLLVWKVIYEYQDRYYVDAVRAGITPTYFPGESAAKLNVEADFPGLDPSSQQALDIERFRWFSDDWLALDDTDTRLIVDMRYSQIPNMIKGLWGIEVQPTADKNAHTLWKARRATGSRELQIFKEQLLGHGARTLPTTGGASNDR